MQNTYNIHTLNIHYVSYLSCVTQYTNIVYERMCTCKSCSPISEDLIPE